jgi:hypothetical protein
VTTRIRLSIGQRTRSGTLRIDGDGTVRREWPKFETRAYGGSGPSVMAVAIRRPIGDVLDAYATHVGAADGHLLELDGFLEARKFGGSPV